jgi:ATP-binding cassette subfamily B protein
MQEIKLHNAEREKRWQWEALQVKLFKINLTGLSLTTMQNSGSSLINELKNILITFLAAKLVIDGHITLGMMLSVSYIIGQLNAPVLEMVRFVQQWQDAKISIDRLSEIHNMENEENVESEYLKNIDNISSFFLKNVSFKYEGLSNEFVLKHLSVEIKANKITAIVGSSGSGKSTLLKLLLKYYNSTEGVISLGSHSLKNVSTKELRSKCGVVMQDGYIFSDTIANNIAIGVNDRIDIQQLEKAVKIANIHEFINDLPLGYNTKIGLEGTGLSAGQKQRILIARAVYKNPDYMFFDEATSALDSNNEKKIMDNLNLFFENKTVVIVAHRLSTVINADQIIVLEKGEIIEYGNHKELSESKGAYYQLVKNQLELGN